jgi:hypothetical protein
MAIIIGLLVIVVLIFRIIQMAGGTRAVYTVVHHQQPADIDEASGYRSPEEIKAISDAMPSEWCLYEGMTPPLMIKIRGQSEENYTRIVRQNMGAIGRENFKFLSEAQKDELHKRSCIEAYVINWEGALYPNGHPLPFSVGNLMGLIERDPLIFPFIIDNAHRLSPPWP